MRSIQSISIFLICVLAVLGAVVYAQENTSENGWDAQNRHRVDLQENSYWFQGQTIGEACRTWFTCKHKGARLRGVYLDQNGERYAIGYADGGEHYLDTHGTTFTRTMFNECQGGHYGVSLELSTEVKNDAIRVRVSSSQDKTVKVYHYELPAGFDPAQKSDMVLIFEAETGGVWQVYEQHSSIRGCKQS